MEIAFDTNPVLSGLIGVVAGDLLGAAVNRFVSVIAERATLSSMLGIVSQERATFLDNLFGVVLHVGILAFGAEMMVRSLPWLTTEPGSYSLFMLGVSVTSDGLRQKLDIFNRFFSFPSIPPSDPASSMIIGPGGTQKKKSAAGGEEVPL